MPFPSRTAEERPDRLVRFSRAERCCRNSLVLAALIAGAISLCTGGVALADGPRLVLVSGEVIEATDLICIGSVVVAIDGQGNRVAHAAADLDMEATCPKTEDDLASKVGEEKTVIRPFGLGVRVPGRPSNRLITDADVDHVDPQLGGDLDSTISPGRPRWAEPVGGPKTSNTTAGEAGGLGGGRTNRFGIKEAPAYGERDVEKPRGGDNASTMQCESLGMSTCVKLPTAAPRMPGRSGQRSPAAVSPCSAPSRSVARVSG